MCITMLTGRSPNRPAEAGVAAEAERVTPTAAATPIPAPEIKRLRRDISRPGIDIKPFRSSGANGFTGSIRGTYKTRPNER
jgi:hypothetical protein